MNHQQSNKSSSLSQVSAKSSQIKQKPNINNTNSISSKNNSENTKNTTNDQEEKIKKIFQQINHTHISSMLKLEQYAFKKFNEFYSNEEDFYNIKIINEIICNDSTHIVAIFKDFLISGDTSEFLQKSYSLRESRECLPKIFEYYDSCSVIFPNYVILPESKYIYKNIQRKQRVIDNQQDLEEKQEKIKKGLIKIRNDDDPVFTTMALDSILDQTDTSGVRKFFGIKNSRNDSKNISLENIIKKINSAENQVNDNKNIKHKNDKNDKNKLNVHNFNQSGNKIKGRNYNRNIDTAFNNSSNNSNLGKKNNNLLNSNSINSKNSKVSSTTIDIASKNNNIYYNNSNTIYVSSSSRNNKNNNIKNSYNNNTYSLNTGIKKQNLLNNLLSNKNKDFIVKVIKELNKNKNVFYTSNINNTSHTKKKTKKQNNIISPSEKIIQNQLQFNKTSSSTHHMKTLSSSSSSAGQGLITSYHNKNTLSMSKLQIASNIQSSYQKNKKSKDKKNENIIKALNIKENIPYTSRESKNSFSPELMQMLNSKIRKIKNLSSNKRISMSISSKKPLIQNTSYGNNKEKQKEYKTINSDLNRNKNTRNKKYDNTTDSLSIGINNKYLSPENKSEKDNNNISKSPPKSPDYNKIMKTYAHFHSKSTFLGNTNNEKLKMKKIKNSVFSNKPELNIKGFQIKGFKQLLQNNTNSNNNSKHSKGSNSDRLLFSESSYKTISKTNRSNSKTFLDMYSILNKK